MVWILGQRAQKIDNYHTFVVQAVSMGLQSGEFGSLDIILSMPDFDMYDGEYTRLQ